MEFGKPRENRGPVCVLVDCQWCGEPCSVGAATLINVARVFIYSHISVEYPTVNYFTFHVTR
jgi:hypothetical protein